MISVIVLTSDSHKIKASCVRHCLASLFNQNFSEYEIILVDNGIDEDKVENMYIENLRLRYPNIIFNKIKNNAVLGRGVARNIGANAAKGELLLFIDEDVILLDKNTLRKISSYYKERKWGCGAERLWTVGDWFKSNSETILTQIENHEIKVLLQNSGEPEKYIRGYEEVAMELRSMIGHFGYCDKELFEKVKGFEDLGDSQSFDDDFLNMKLYLAYGLPKLFPNIQIIHINHSIHGSRDYDFKNFSKKLIKLGVLDFDSKKLIYGEGVENIITFKASISYNTSILNAYKDYQTLHPLNIYEMDECQKSFWVKNIQYGIDDYCRLASSLMQTSSLEIFIKEQSVDFDNLAPIVESLVRSSILNINKNGTITPILLNKEQNRPSFTSNNSRFFIPKKEFNQFPCDESSVKKRVELFKTRYPYCDYLRVGLIGDDDFLAKEMLKENWINIILVEKDINILNQYENQDNIQLVELDLLNIDPEKISRIPKLHTFITDPPYTINGSLLFIYAGLSLLELDQQEKEFYLVINPMIIGRPFNKLLKVLHECGIYLKDLIRNFSHYPFPEDYSETKRALSFLHQNKIENLTYSSTSNLYIFGVTNPNLKILSQYISKDLIYNHYRL